MLLDNFSTLDVGCRFLNLLPTATLLKIVKSKIGKAFGAELLIWLRTLRHNSSEGVCPGVDFVIELKRLKDAVDNSNPQDGENPYYTIDAGIVLESEAITVLEKIAPLYFAKVRKRFNVNSGTRDSYRQSDAMYNVYMSGGRTFPLYKNRKAANELIAVIEKGESKEITIKKMTDVIQRYFEQNILMSPHQRAGAIDIDVNGDEATGVAVMSTLERKIMMEIATKITGFAAKLETEPLHIHIRFK